MAGATVLFAAGSEHRGLAKQRLRRFHHPVHLCSHPAGPHLSHLSPLSPLSFLPPLSIFVTFVHLCAHLAERRGGEQVVRQRAQLLRGVRRDLAHRPPEEAASTRPVQRCEGAPGVDQQVPLPPLPVAVLRSLPEVPLLPLQAASHGALRHSHRAAHITFPLLRPIS